MAEADAATALVSIVVPVLDGEAHLRESLDSILGQTYPNVEVIVMDDGSSDATAEIVASYGDRLAYARQPERRGIYANANDGIELARGEFVCVYHGDDVYEPEIVAREVAYLERHPDVGAVFCKDVFIDAASRPFGRLELPEELAGGRPLDYRTVLDALLRRRNVFLRCPSGMVRASVYRELGGYDQDRFKNTSDIEMWLRIARHHHLGVIDEHLFLYRRGHGSSSERYHTLRTEPDRFFEIMDLELELGGRGVATAAALSDYEAHRAEDSLKVAASNYVLGEGEASQDTLATVSAAQILRSRHPRRTSVFVLLLVMRALLWLPRLAPAAKLLQRRIYGRPRALGT